MKKNKLNIRTFLSITLTIMLFGFVGVYFSVKTIREQYIDIQLKSNQRTAETIAKLFSDKLNAGVKESELIRSFQSSIEGTRHDEGYLCMFDQNDGVLLCHPDTNAIGMSINSDNYQFLNLNGMMNESFHDVVSTDKEEYGILNINNQERSELAYMVPVSGTNWKISVHENLDKTEKMLIQLQWIAFSGFFLLSILISFIATWIVRRINRNHEMEIESKNNALQKSNDKLIDLNHQIEKQNTIITKHADNLEFEVKKRTAELQNIYTKLAGLEKAKSDFLTIISHELRTPLNGIIGFSSLLEEELKNTDHLEFVKSIKISGERLFRFSETALLVTQLNTQSDRIEYQSIPVIEMIEELWEASANIVTDKKLMLKFDRNGGCKTIAGVPKMIKQCFGNILENALEHSPLHGVIRISCIQESNHVFITIQDKGTGFSEEAFLRQFDLFGADKVMYHNKGFGLGLAAAQLIMKAHSGEIKLSNHSEGGALVCLKFPVSNLTFG